MSFKKFKLVPFESDTSLHDLPTTPMVNNPTAPKHTVSNSGNIISAPVNPVIGHDVNGSSIFYAPKEPSTLAVNVQQSILESIPNEKEQKRAQILLHFLKQIGLKLTNQNEILYSDGVIGSPIEQMVSFLVSDEQGLRRPFDLLKFIDLLEEQEAKGLFFVPTGYFGKGKQELIRNLEGQSWSNKEKNIGTKTSSNKPRRKRTRGSSTSLVPPATASTLKWQNLF